MRGASVCTGVDASSYTRRSAHAGIRVRDAHHRGDAHGHHPGRQHPHPSADAIGVEARDRTRGWAGRRAGRHEHAGRGRRAETRRLLIDRPLLVPGAHRHGHHRHTPAALRRPAHQRTRKFPLPSSSIHIPESRHTIFLPRLSHPRPKAKERRCRRAVARRARMLCVRREAEHADAARPGAAFSRRAPSAGEVEEPESKERDDEDASDDPACDCTHWCGVRGCRRGGAVERCISYVRLV